ncbi:tight adherence pilus pseudopilin TadF [Escherichia albertii]|uniref:tight adherence pilus pseudopilin TadF n=1 Tax=Escherichia albertii TaxID=208962 RepID=UPI00138696AD|nr:tight adherence pilus pseudopilin TadF [Escherichia albertii]
MTFVKSSKGSAVIEFVGFFIILSILLIIAVNICMYLSSKSHLDRVNASVLEIVRNRDLFYNGENNLSENDTSELKKLAKYLFYKDALSDEKMDVLVRLCVKGDKECPDNLEKYLINDKDKAVYEVELCTTVASHGEEKYIFIGKKICSKGIALTR